MHETLVIAPTHDDLTGVADESATIAAHMGGRLLQGDVTVRRILDHIDRRSYGRLWVCSHAGERGVLLSGGEVLAAEQLAWICTAVGAQELVINTCHSSQFVVQIQLLASVDVLFSIAEIPDQEAMVVAQAIAQNYTQSNDLEKSYRAVTGGTGLYRYLPNAKRARAMNISSNQPPLQNGELSRQVLKNQYALDSVKQNITALDRQIQKLGEIVEELRRAAYSTTVVNHPAMASPTDYKLILAAVIIGSFVFAGLYFGGAGG